MNNRIKSSNGFYRSFIFFTLLGAMSNSSAYQLIDLGANVTPNAINNSGIIVGSSNTDQYPATAFRWSSDSGFDILDGISANAVNNEGQVAGNTISGAFILDGSHYREWNNYAAFGSNQTGDVAGYQVGQNPFQPRSLPYNPAIYNGSKWEVSDIAGIYSRGTREGVYADRFILNGINTDGYSVGYKYRYGLTGSAAILIDPNTVVKDLSDVIYLPTPSGGKAVDINDHNMIIGTTGSNSSTSPAVYSQAYIYDYNTDNLFILPVLDGGLRSSAYDINEYNQVVGSSETLVNITKVNHAFLWKQTDGTIIDLNDLLTDGSITAPGWVFTSANAINDNGDIVGSGLLNGVQHGFVITTGQYAGQAPVAIANADVSSGKGPLMVNFDSSGSTDSDGNIMSYFWDFMDGSSSIEENPMHIFTEAGSYNVILTVTDNDDMQSSNTITITVRKGKRK